jgi:hypothetical protein
VNRMRRQGVLVGIGIVLAGILVGGLEWHAEEEQRRAIVALPAAERRALVGRTLLDLDLLCGDAVLSRQCEAAARLLLLVPECDAACRHRATSYLPRATR